MMAQRQQGGAERIAELAAPHSHQQQRPRSSGDIGQGRNYHSLTFDSGLDPCWKAWPGAIFVEQQTTTGLLVSAPRKVLPATGQRPVKSSNTSKPKRSTPRSAASVKSPVTSTSVSSSPLRRRARSPRHRQSSSPARSTALEVMVEAIRAELVLAGGRPENVLAEARAVVGLQTLPEAANNCHGGSKPLAQQASELLFELGLSVDTVLAGDVRSATSTSSAYLQKQTPPRTLAPGCVHIDMASVLDDLEATIGELDRDTISAHNPLAGVNDDGQRHNGHAAIHTVADDD
eukprot:SAG25_NODE_3370_length_1108_cov_1.226957_1_plen_288_part_10